MQQSQTTTITLGDIIQTYELGLVLIAGADDDSLATPVQWVHTSELLDPAPFLTPRTVLLTTGSQFSEALSPNAALEYVSRLQGAGISALGFAVEIFHERMPQELIQACEHLRLPLFRVPYDTPFIAITQSATRQLTAASFARERWSLETQRAISRAAMRRLGTTAAIDELAARLGRWVTLSNRNGTLIHASPAAPTAEHTAAWITEAISEVGTRNTRANVTRNHQGERIHLHTVSGMSGVQGVIAVESSLPLDHAERSAIEQVATLAALQFEQHRQLSSGRSRLKSAVLTLLLMGEADTAVSVSAAFNHHLPSDRIMLFSLGDTDSIAQETFEQLQTLSSQLDAVLVGEHDDTVLLLTPPKHRARIAQFCEQMSLTAGVSRQHRLENIADALTQAQSAYRFARTTARGKHVHEFAAQMSEGVTSLLREHPLAHERAHQLLSPILEHDVKHGESLTKTLEVWLNHHGQNSPAAAELGLHRHTVAGRIRLISELLGRDLTRPQDRAELTIALTLR